MDGCNTINTAVTNNPIFMGLELASAVGSIFTLTVIFHTSILKGAVRTILINDLVAAFINQMIGTVNGLFIDVMPNYVKIGMHSAAFAFTNAILLFMILSNINLYLALCKPTEYNVLVTKRRVVIAITLVWVMTVCGAVLSFVEEDYITIDCLTGLPTETESNVWISIARILFYRAIPLVVSCFCLWKIIQESHKDRPNLSLSAAKTRHKKLKLIRLLLVTTIIECLIGVTSTVFVNLDAMFKPTSDGRKPSAYIGTILRLYLGLRPIVFFICYQPLVETVKNMMSFCSRPTGIKPEYKKISKAWTTYSFTVPGRITRVQHVIKYPVTE